MQAPQLSKLDVVGLRFQMQVLKVMVPDVWGPNSLLLRETLRVVSSFPIMGHRSKSGGGRF